MAAGGRSAAHRGRRGVGRAWGAALAAALALSALPCGPGSTCVGGGAAWGAWRRGPGPAGLRLRGGDGDGGTEADQRWRDDRMFDEACNVPADIAPPPAPPPPKKKRASAKGGGRGEGGDGPQAPQLSGWDALQRPEDLDNEALKPQTAEERGGEMVGSRPQAETLAGVEAAGGVGRRGQVAKTRRGAKERIAELGDKKPGFLLSADLVGSARRDAKEKKDLASLHDTLGYSEWKKLSSAKHRKKQRKLAAREHKRDLLEQQVRQDAAMCEARLPSLSNSLSIAPSQRFDASNLGRGMLLSQGGLVVRRAPGANAPSFVFFGDPAATGLSRYTLRIDSRKNSMYVGVMTLPWEPVECFAKFLQSHAWMLADSGKVFQTQPGTPRTPLMERVIPMPDSGVKQEIEIPLIGTQQAWSKHKFRAHRYALRAGSLLKMDFDRQAGTVSFCVDDREWFTLEGVSRHARPFLNFFAANDGASILSAEDGKSLPDNMQ